MSIATALLALTAVAVLSHVLVFLGLRWVDRRSGATRDRTANAERVPGPHRSAPVSTARAGSRSHPLPSGATYHEVGAWSGRTHPPGAVVVGYDGKAHGRAALAWAAHEAARRDVPLVVVYAANYPGMTGPPGPGLWHRDPGALEAAEEVTASGVAEARAAVPGLDVVGATEVTSPVQALVEASRDAALVVVGSRGSRRLVGTLRRSVGFDVGSQAHAPVVVVRTAASPPAPARGAAPARRGVSATASIR